MAEVRTTSSTGGQKGVKPQRIDLVPYPAIKLISEVYAFGAEKYADHNWRRKYEWGKSIAALERHIGEFKEGRTYDRCEDDCEFYHETGDGTCRNHSGLHHLAHAGFHIFALLTWFDEDGDGPDNPFDDRWSSAMERRRREEAAEAEEEGSGEMFWAPLPATDISVYQRIIDDEIKRIAVGAWTNLGHINADGFGVEWQDPEPRTTKGVQEVLDKISAVTTARFACDGDGVITDDAEHQHFAVRWVRGYDEEVAPQRAFLNDWINRPSL